MINSLLPKDELLWVFRSPQDFNDSNARAFYEYIKSHKPEVRAVWLVKSIEIAKRLERRGVVAIPHNSLAGLWTFLRAATLVVTWDQFRASRVARQRTLNLWHGMPIKSIMHFKSVQTLKPKTMTGRRCTSSRDLVIATSSLTRNILSAAFGLPPSQVPIVGQPRTDRFFKSENPISQWLKHRAGAQKGEKYVLMLPTYRDGSSKDGKSISSIFGKRESWAEIAKSLAAEGAHLIVKLHPGEQGFIDTVSDFPRIHIVTDAELHEADVDLYDLIGLASVLITDYSSVYIDFLLLDRPMIFYVPDLVDYRSQRGFLLEPYEFWTPGPKVFTMEQLKSELRAHLRGHDPYQSRRREMLPVFHDYVDGEATRRIASLLGD